MASATKDSEFLGKTALVTGSSTGIGRAIALNLAGRGAQVTLCGRDVIRLEATLQDCIQASGGHADRFFVMTGDVCDSAHRNELVENTVSKFGSLDVLVCNAGSIALNDRIFNTTEKDFDKMINILVKSVYFLIQTAIPHLEKTKGNIVSISSVAAKMPSIMLTSYAIAKAAVDQMTRCVALDVGPRGIRVNTVNPGLVITRLFRDDKGQVSDEKSAALSAKDCAMYPLEKRLVTLEEIAEGVAFLASDRASFITGHHLMVDGGRTLLGPTIPDT